MDVTSPDDRSGASWLRYSHLGLQYCLTLLLATGLGYLADEKWGTEPWLLVAGSFLGFVLATYQLVRAVSRIPG